MSDDNNNPIELEDLRENTENDSQRLHRLVLPMILDILRDRRRPFINIPHDHQEHSHVTDSDESQLSRDETMSDVSPSHVDNSPVHMLPDQDVNTTDATASSEDLPRTTDQQGQLIPSSLSPPSSRRPRYRLVVYFEERAEETTNHTEDDLSAPRAAPRPSRYVAVFSIDSDAQNMPIIHSAGLQNTPANFDDILNQLFTSYIPKGTPPAKKEIIDTLPTSIYTSNAAQPKCAVCLDDFEEGSEIYELPCSHKFHGESCVKPWLRIHSSCPVCRYELPVDDAEYEQKRIERMAARTPPRDLIVVDKPDDMDI